MTDKQLGAALWLLQLLAIFTAVRLLILGHTLPGFLVSIIFGVAVAWSFRVQQRRRKS